MIDIAVNDLNKFYGANHVLKGISFEINSGEKVGLLGKNGSGKTTLFKTITGDEPIDSGTIAKSSGKKIEMLAQLPEFGEADTTDDILRSAFSEVTEVYRAMKKLEGDPDPIALKRYGRLLDNYEQLGGYDVEVKLDKVCSGMRIDDRLRHSLFRTLSGGEQSRVNLARILLRDCDMLLLDEPTNHLDLASLAWLEDFLREYRGTVITISHDRAFLDRVVTRIIEITDGAAHFYSGNYSYYVEAREQRFLTQAEQYKQQQKKIAQLEAAIKRQRVWAAINPSNTGLAKRALAMEKRIEQMDKVDRPKTDKKLTSAFDSGSYAARAILNIDNLSKRFGDKPILRGLTLSIGRYDRIALIGPNGCGKSTLIKIMMDELAPDGGSIRITPNAKIGYMPQIITFEADDQTLLSLVRDKTGASEAIARSTLAHFHFMAEDVMKKVSVLSGGEKSRLKLCLLMQQNLNFLILDEPTNHLDIASREWIESALMDFEGCMLFVSHDRYFLNKFADRIWAMDDGRVETYDCGFEDYLELISPKPVPAPARKPAKKPAPKQPQPKSEKSIEQRIAESEAEMATIDRQIAADLANNDYTQMKRLHAQKEQLTEQVDELYAQWIDI